LPPSKQTSIGTTNIIWSKASTKGGNWIVLLIDNTDDFHHFWEKLEVGGKFIVVSWVGTTIEETDHYKKVIRPLMPLIITPLFSDHHPKQAVALIAGHIQCQKIDPSKGLPGQGEGSPKKEPNSLEYVPHQACGLYYTCYTGQ
jgi:hypothetical protein